MFIKDYPVLSRPSGAGGDGGLVVWDKTRNAKLRGHGILDANRPELEHAFWPRERGRRELRHQYMESAQDCIMEGVILTNSVLWTVHPVDCDRILFKSVRILNRTECCAVDQFDIDACREVTLENCFAYGGDDSFCIKATVKEPTEIHHLTVRNSVSWSTSSNGLRVGADARETNWITCNDILFENVHFLQAGELAMSIQLCGAGSCDNWRFVDCSTEGTPVEVVGLGNNAWDRPCEIEPPDVSNFRWENLTMYGSREIGSREISIMTGRNITFKCLTLVKENPPITIVIDSRAKAEDLLYVFPDSVTLEGCD